MPMSGKKSFNDCQPIIFNIIGYCLAKCGEVYIAISVRWLYTNIIIYNDILRRIKCLASMLTIGITTEKLVT